MTFITETERLKLRVLEASDIEDLVEIWGDSEVMQYCGGALEGSHRLCRSVQYYETVQAVGGISAYSVVLKETDAMIGVCGVNASGETGVYELIYHFKKEFWKNGYATEACKAFIEMARTVRGKIELHKFVASVSPENKASGRVLEKCGFVFVGEKWFEDTKRFEPMYEYRF